MRRLEVLYSDSVEITVRMGGLFEDFTPLRDQWARMSGGRWTETVRAFFEAVASHHRMPMNASRMIEGVDDFTSTWPACVAAKAAELQGQRAGPRYLRALREAWFIDGRAIHRRGVQAEVATEVGLDSDRFQAALDDGTADRAFREDRQECEDLGVTGFPTFEISRQDFSARLSGWQPWEVFADILQKAHPDLEARRIETTDAFVEDLFRRYDRLATREVAAVLGITDDDAEILLEELEEKARVVRRPVGHGIIWERGS